MRAHRLEGIYPGDREGKAGAREEIYSAFQQALGARRFLRSNHLVLGGDGGDIELLSKKYGVASEKIFVIDHSPAVIKRLRKKYPLCQFFSMGMEEAAMELQRRGIRFGSLNLDLCSNLYNSVLMSIATVLNLLLKKGTCVAVTIRADREREFEPYAAVERAKKKVPATFGEYINALSRALALQFLLDEQYGISGLKAWVYYAYRSKGRDLRGAPRCTSMSVFIGGGLQLHSPWRRKRFMTDQKEKERQSIMMIKHAELEPHTEEDALTLRKLIEESPLTITEACRKAGIIPSYGHNLVMTGKGQRPRRSRKKWAALLEVLAGKREVKTRRGPQQRNDSELRAAVQKLVDKKSLSHSEIARVSRVHPKTVSRFLSGEPITPRVAQQLNEAVVTLNSDKKKAKAHTNGKHSTHAAPAGDDFDFELARFEKLDALYSKARTPDQKRRVAALLVA